MRRIALKIAYEGTDYAGWQRQENGPSIQQTIEDTVFDLFHERVDLMGSGRTDAGVHARGQIAAMDMEHPIPTDKLILALNSNLPEDIRIYEAWEADKDFHPRFQAKRKTYEYVIFQGPVCPPELRRFAWHVKDPMDLSLMEEAARKLVGTHDFAAFRSTGGMNLSTVRTVEEVKIVCEPVEETKGRILRLRITGNGFLYNMVRIIAGTLKEIGQERLPVTVIEEALQKGDRLLLGPTAPAQGLFLVSVEYPEG
ncbi:MAG: tRNA pseudouridine(38-40) synthase TruA [Firmicutes bacterium]|nr:tRNA pseudouridine(38-40) synthase TruA [Bacillota bacterium]